MDIKLKKQILDTFSNKLRQNFTFYCDNQGEEPGIDNFTTYILDRGFINDSLILRYAVLHTFEEMRTQSDLTKTQLVEVLAEKFNLTPRSIWNALRAKGKTYN